MAVFSLVSSSIPSSRSTILPSLALVVLTPIIAFLTRLILYRRRLNNLTRSLGAKRPQNVETTKEPLLGLDYMFESLSAAKKGQYLPLIWRRFQTLGTTYVTRRLFLDTVYTTSPENIRAMLSTDFHSFRITHTRVAAMTPLFGSGIFVSDGEKWQHSRAMIRPVFSRNNMQPLLPLLERHFRALVGQIPREDGTTFDLQSLFARMTMDAASEFLFGHSTGSLERSGAEEDSYYDFAADFKTCCLEGMTRIKMGPLHKILPQWLGNKSWEGAKKRVWAHIDVYVKEALERRRSGKGKDMNDHDGEDGPEYSFLNELTKEIDDPVELRSEILNMLQAGRDTTAGLLSHFFYLVARNQEVYRKLRVEIRDRVGDGLPTDAVLNNSMPYLRWCINETLRLYPVVPANSREAAVDTTLPLGGGPEGQDPVLVSKGTSVIYSVFAMHRNPEIYGDDVEVFRPERWDGLRPGWGYLPFNGGPRICVGKQFALTEASYIIVRMIQTYPEMEARDERPWMELYGIALASRHGTLVGIPSTSAGLKE